MQNKWTFLTICKKMFPTKNTPDSKSAVSTISFNFLNNSVFTLNVSNLIHEKYVIFSQNNYLKINSIFPNISGISCDPHPLALRGCKKF